MRTKVPEVVDNFTSPLQVGNGDFAFNVDNTGMQTLIPFNTLSSWGWHKDRLPENGYVDYAVLAGDPHRDMLCG